MIERSESGVIRIRCAGQSECAKIFKGLKDIINGKGYATVLDLYRIIGENAPTLDTVKLQEIGWFDNDIDRVRRDYYHCLYFPEPIFIKPIKNAQNYESADKMVSHPDHYQSSSGLEVIDVISAFTDGLNGIEATDTGNIIKYACCWHKKNGIQNLEKILWYTQHLINHLKNKEKENLDNEEKRNHDESQQNIWKSGTEDKKAQPRNSYSSRCCRHCYKCGISLQSYNKNQYGS